MFLDQLLDPKRKEIFQKLSAFGKVAVLGGGTALALQLGHRKSYDFDLLTERPISSKVKQQVLATFGKKKIQILNDTSGELTFFTHDQVKITFLHFPFPPLHSLITTLPLPLFDIKDLASHKAYLLGRRPAYRDYVDIYFLLQYGFSLKQIIKEAQRRFEGGFSEKLFLQQLTYFDDLDDFEIEFIGEKQPSPPEVKRFLEKEVRNYLSPDF
ncbi:hypothetical protein HKBW3S44_00587 [Candidatus Hakubella thermalkaliphila]|uniref:Nucleotidyl transferase AbiEii toxin, Type IV TA system n=1 Tax=Candidatus Hakubella thermalkaliphila TaxID=2754717 RepID=A0A6V8NQH8_9ACTN|nr:nucleotidyl transferase AbiEii/AbiGii toxin family protein [Candidatus Hakubella thermalkaliphila]GFP22649.1 hypothetical protein HKBW3S09_00117 [Candidatus Hakubella thermalkaliphila]GFP29551.1 hypothetical protein HKBW3S34_00471 [Candidatus Hakubella thermalkaliphila]GFP36906.1 hypothetical protein HKBW3S44_00587 [Candidatus Hakubella thermalkaliphila]GFP38543.1 hypothetical protein HKBW3S47_00244 [Candidatus Hakubella thermalkaliphila]